MEVFKEVLCQFLDFALITAAIFFFLYVLRNTRELFIMLGLIGLGFVLFLAKILGLTTMTWVLDTFFNSLPIVLIVVFLPELRRTFAQLGSRVNPFAETAQKQTIREIISAVTQMSLRRTGALIVLERKIGLAALKASAVQLKANVNSTLLQSIFYPNSPLHDGAVIVRGNVIEAAHAVLPLTIRHSSSSMKLGTRHRAALGISEETDALVVVVSEETGRISLAENGKLRQNLSPDGLEKILDQELSQKGLFPILKEKEEGGIGDV